MRFNQVETISFTDINGVTRPVKDIRPIPEQALSFTVELKQGDSIDEIASRENVYGAGAEGQAHRIFDFNITEIVDAGFDLSKLKRLRIPVP